MGGGRAAAEPLDRLVIDHNVQNMRFAVAVVCSGKGSHHPQHRLYPVSELLNTLATQAVRSHVAIKVCSYGGC